LAKEFNSPEPSLSQDQFFDIRRMPLSEKLGCRNWEVWFGHSTLSLTCSG
jgi:hypothetical protein